MTWLRQCAVDLSTGAAESSRLDERLPRLFLGGRGVNGALLLKAHTEPLEPLDPRAPLFIGAGPLAGLPCPSPSRTQITGRSPESGLLADSNLGGHFSPALRRAGFELLTVVGAADTPAYLLIENGRASLHDAAPLWGRDCVETMELLRQAHGPRARALVIGPAGENLVRFACVRHGRKSAAGKGGLGCLMGAKKLKAVVAVGSGGIPVHDRAGTAAFGRELNERLRRSRTRRVLHELGTAFLYDLHSFGGWIRVRNGRGNTFREGRTIRSKALKKLYSGHRACHGCVIACRHTYLRNRNGRTDTGVGVEYGTLGAFGPICGLTDPGAILLLNDLTNDLGLDSCATGNLIAWAIECFEEGLIGPAETNGLTLRFGDADLVAGLVRDIAARRGFGAALADGPGACAERFGPEAERLLMWSKGSVQTDAVDVRAFKGFALGAAVSTRGADHLRGRPTMEALSIGEDRLRELFGADVSADPLSYRGKAAMVRGCENEYALADALGICRFAQRFNSPDHLSPDDLRRLTNSATGTEYSPEAFDLVGERIIATERLFLGRLGVGRADDSLPARYFEPMPEGRLAGERIDRDRFEAMLDEYYALRGYDPATGMPTKKTLARLGIDSPARARHPS